jgi:hypothetical protein
MQPHQLPKGEFMDRRTLRIAGLIGAVCIVSVVLATRVAHSADHLDSPKVKLDPTSDINDLYAWMDGNNLVLALTLFPAATGAPADAGPDAGAISKFSNAVQYVIHTSSGPTFGTSTAKEDVICTFDVSQKISCWVGTDEYVTGDASQTTGLASADGKVKVFAGIRADPFFFNLDGFKHTVATVESAASTLTLDPAGCPILNGPTAAALRSQLQTAPDGGPPSDFFAPLNGLAIVLSIDKSLVTKGGAIVSTWASTHRAP